MNGQGLVQLAATAYVPDIIGTVGCARSHERVAGSSVRDPDPFRSRGLAV